MSGSEWLDAHPDVRREEPLARHSQFGVGGPAQWFAQPRDAASLADLIRRSDETGVPVTMIGAGSNTLILDSGIRGLVMRFIDRRQRVVDPATIELAAGCMMPRVALDCARQGLAGLEFGIGVPGTCGASVYGNAGAFGTEMADVLVDCTVLNARGDRVVIDRDELGFAYRHSRLKDDLSGSVVVSARLRVHTDDAAAVRARTDAIQAERKASQPYGVRSLGSVFKNPPGDAAGRLIEAAGLKGRKQGGAVISPKHANFICNVAHASSADVLALVELARDEVLDRFGVDLEREIIVIGEPAPVAGSAAR
jgi:UDP-N-acetylmuramate dehydrogenase